MQQRAWFDSKPSLKAAGSRRAAEPQEQPSRGEKIKADGKTLLLPPIGDDLRYMVDNLYAAGLCGAGSFSGLTALSSSELAAWQNGTYTELSAWEFQTLLEMSSAYVRFLRMADDPACPPPYGEPAQMVDRNKLAKGLGSMLRGMAAAPVKGKGTR